MLFRKILRVCVLAVSFDFCRNKLKINQLSLVHAFHRKTSYLRKEQSF